MSPPRFTPIPPKSLTHVEVQRLLAARDLNKPDEFPEMIENILSGSWSLYRIDGGVKGVVVLNPEPPLLNIFYLHGEGLFGKIGQVAKALLDIAEEKGLSGLSLVTSEYRKARLFSMAKGTKVRVDGDRYIAELRNGR